MLAENRRARRTLLPIFLIGALLIGLVIVVAKLIYPTIDQSMILGLLFFLVVWGLIIFCGEYVRDYFIWARMKDNAVEAQERNLTKEMEHELRQEGYSINKINRMIQEGEEFSLGPDGELVPAHKSKHNHHEQNHE